MYQFHEYLVGVTVFPFQYIQQRWSKYETHWLGFYCCIFPYIVGIGRHLPVNSLCPSEVMDACEEIT